MELAEKIYAAVRLIPRGKVATYSQIAALSVNCNLRRYVGDFEMMRHLFLKTVIIFTQQQFSFNLISFCAKISL